MGGAPVDLDKWMQAIQNNPDREKFLPTQISSTKELKDRTLAVLKGIKDAKARLKSDKESLELVQKACESDVEQQMKSVQEKNLLIR